MSVQNNFTPLSKFDPSPAQSPAHPSDSPASESPAIPTNFWKLVNAAQNLNELSDQLTAKVVEIESAINKLNLGVRTTVTAEKSSLDEYGAWVVSLGYGKPDGKWGFTVAQYHDADPENTYEEWGFKEAPRDLRLKVVGHIPQLLDALTTASTNLASEINDKITLAKKLFSLLPQPSPSGSKK